MGELSGWRWIILEGLPAIILGIVVLFYLTDKPKHAKWLTEEDGWKMTGKGTCIKCEIA